jgi:hypothetical protein
MKAMRHVIPRAGSRKVSGYVKAVLALGEASSVLIGPAHVPAHVPVDGGSVPA